mmetsp:Transcript_87079/g.224254  ORF Transcript_87079/g.224254 Transcript_87079/m.224254 type:complete len:370 (-) Transcript_87079:187-1296(-)
MKLMRSTLTMMMWITKQMLQMKVRNCACCCDFTSKRESSSRFLKNSTNSWMSMSPEQFLSISFMTTSTVACVTFRPHASRDSTSSSESIDPSPLASISRNAASSIFVGICSPSAPFSWLQNRTFLSMTGARLPLPSVPVPEPLLSEEWRLPLRAPASSCMARSLSLLRASSARFWRGMRVSSPSASFIAFVAAYSENARPEKPIIEAARRLPQPKPVSPLVFVAMPRPTPTNAQNPASEARMAPGSSTRWLTRTATSSAPAAAAPKNIVRMEKPRMARTMLHAPGSPVADMSAAAHASAQVTVRDSMMVVVMSSGFGTATPRSNDHSVAVARWLIGSATSPMVDAPVHQGSTRESTPRMAAVKVSPAAP